MGIDTTPSAGLSPTLKLEKPLSSATADEIRAAAAAALKALPAGRSTVFFVESDEPSGPEEGSGPDTPGDANSKPELSPTVTARPASSPPASPTVVGNPLAGLLGGYSDDETSENGAESPRVDLQQRNSSAEQMVQQKDLQQQEEQKVQQQDLQQQQEQQQPACNSMQEHEQQPAQEDDPINAEVANFLQELETCGLLCDAEMTDAAPAEALQQQPVTAGHTPAEADTAEAAPVAAQACTDAAEAADGTSVADGAADAVTDADSPAEQCTLGYLAAAPEWCKVLDTASGKPYYWNVNTNEVLWELPEGIDGDALLPLGEASADEHASAAVPAAEPAAAAGVDLKEAGAAEAAAAMRSQSAPAERQVGSGIAADQASSRLATPPVAEQAAASTPGDANAQEGNEQQPQQQSAQPAPQQDVQAVFLTLLSELQVPPAAQQVQQQLPEAVKLTLQLQLLHQQWQTFAAQQQAAADSDDPAAGFTWVHYELYIMQQLQQVVQRLQPAVQELERLGAQSPLHRACSKQPDQSNQQQHQIGQPQTDQAAGKAGGPAAAVDIGQTAAAGAAAAGGSPKEDGEIEAAAAAAANGESSEEGEVAGSEQESEDMDVDTDGSPHKAPASAAASAKQGSTVKAGESAAAQAGPAGRYTAAGTFASTAHMPDWARPSYHYDFHAPHQFHGYGYDYDAYHHPCAAGEYTQHYPGAGYNGYSLLYDAAGYSGYGRAGYNTDGYGVAAAAAEEAAAEQPPLPEDVPPPLPDEPLPPGHSTAELPPLPEASTEVTETAAAVASAPKQKAVVAQPAIRRAAAQATFSETPAAQDAAVAAGGIVEARKRPRDKESKPAGAASKLKKTGKMSALINKWASVRQQQEAEELERQRRLSEAANPEVQEAKRLQQLENWRLSQLESGAGEENPNFTPVVGDWRARLGLADGDAAAAAADDAGARAAGDAHAQTAEEKAARKAARKAAKAAKAAAVAAAQAAVFKWPTNSKTKPDLKALSKGLPAGWQAMWDKETGDIYYGNPSTKEVSWDRPTE